MFLELEGELVNLDRVRKVTYDEDHDCTILHYDRDYATDSLRGDLRVPILAAAGGKSVEAA